ncbi:MAG TPA: Calx-beta domain-containing protein [Candidatus Limnocylindrales bacterium]|nr:Calx-beta domain-containing protein [Candidatus Limnocylindrales bacterium]
MSTSSLVLALLMVPIPASASECGAVSIVESGLTLSEGTSGLLHIDSGDCAPGQYEILTDTVSPPDFDVTVSPSKKEVNVYAVMDLLPETEDELEVAVWRLGQAQPDDSAKVTIAGESFLGPILSLSNVRGGETIAQVRVNLSIPPAADVNFVYDLFDGTATSPGDFAPITGGRGVIRPGQTEGTIEVRMQTDGLAEPEEHFTLRLRTVSGAGVSDETAVITIEGNET